MRWLPILSEIGAPLAFKSFRVATAHPELGFFKMDRLRPGIEGALNTHTEELPVICAGAHIVHVASMAYLMSFAVGLGLVFVIHSIEAAIQIVLVMAPRNSAHHVNAISMLAPG